MKDTQIIQPASIQFSERGGTLGAPSMGDATKRRREMEECVRRYNRAHPQTRVILSVGLTLDENAFVVKVSPEAGCPGNAGHFIHWLARCAPDEAAKWVLPASDAERVEKTATPKSSAPPDPPGDATNEDLSPQTPFSSSSGAREQIVGVEPNEGEVEEGGIPKDAVHRRSDAAPKKGVDQPVAKAEPDRESSVASQGAFPDAFDGIQMEPAQPALPRKEPEPCGDPNASFPSLEGDAELQNSGQRIDLHVPGKPGGMDCFQQPASEGLNLEPTAAEPCASVEVLLESFAFAVLYVEKGGIIAVAFSSEEELARFLRDPGAGAFEVMATTNMLHTVEILG